jgi:hypothetical protein
MIKYHDNLTQAEIDKIINDEKILDYIYGIVEDMERLYYNETYYNEYADEKEIDINDPAWDLQSYQFISNKITDEQFDILCQSVYYRVWAYA